MTIAIHRQPRFQKVLVAFGLVGVLAIATVAAVEMTATDSHDTVAPMQRRVPGGGREALQLEPVQDGYLASSPIVAEQAAAAAWMRLQDGYLPPSGSPAGEKAAFIAVQDGYLVPQVWVAPVEDDTIRLGAGGPQ
jgi:hypothetical protein